MLKAVTRSGCGLWWAVCIVAVVPDPISQEAPICESCCLLVIPPEPPASVFLLLLFCSYFLKREKCSLLTVPVVCALSTHTEGPKDLDIITDLIARVDLKETREDFLPVLTTS